MHSLHPLINWSILFSRPRLSFQQSRQRKLVQQENCAGRKCIPFIHLSIGAGRKLSLLSLFSDSHLLFESNVITYQQRGDEAPTIKGNHPREKGGTIFFLQLRGKFLLISVKWGKGIGRRKTSCNFLCLKKNFDCIWTLNS